ncbi:hypothetical protein BFP70_04700 [Thioclava sp. SK-1]|uniref:siderophore-interacting protein n=1 Tax=Thioclava sp. SK-1 TaxID=1889770 RepID=UPI00082420E5|nr:siderophore-interacting protein [Thioclava sp. SK-1]OCX66527.1 hypothetical protein BFP70_04700 [Thioclava sp. SK-1]
MSLTQSFSTNGQIITGAAAAQALIKLRGQDYGCELTETPGRLQLSLWGCLVTLTHDGGAALVQLAAPEDRLIRMVQDNLTELLSAQDLAIAWDDVAAGALAPGLSVMQVAWVNRISAGFWRVRVRAQPGTLPDADRFARGGLHFRLLIPADSSAPVWPRINKKGRVDWPEGNDAPHRAVYTVSAQAEDWVEFDIFDHPGSPTCDWVRTMPIGQPVGLLGPGGGFCPSGAALYLLGDETALPAIRRIMELASVPVHIWVSAPAEDLPENATYSPDLLQDLAGIQAGEDGFVWFAAQADLAKAARKMLLAKGLAKTRFMAAAYW